VPEARIMSCVLALDDDLRASRGATHAGDR
jgi:hypothetical protein